MQKTGKWQQLAVSVAAAVSYVVLKGYQFNGGDQEEHLPFVYKLIDPGLYASDYIVPEQTATFTVRFYFAHVLALLGRIFPLPQTVFVIYLITLVSITSALSGLARVYSGSLASLLAPWSLLVFGGMTVGGNDWTDVQLTCTAMAMAFCSQALLANEKGNTLLAAFLCGLGSLFQVLIGLQLAVLLILLNLTRRQTKGLLARIPLLAGVYFVTAAPMLVPIMLQQSEGVDSALHQEFIRTMFYIRNAHHYVPAAFPVSDYLLTGAWWTLLWFLSGRIQSTGLKDLFRVMLGGVLAGIVVYVIGFGIFNSATVAKTQWFKATVWPGMVGGVLLSAWLSEKWLSYSVPAWMTKVAWTAAIFLLLVITHVIPVPSERFARRYEVGRYLPQPLEKMHRWINDSIPESAVVLAPPDDPSFLCEARRSMPVGYKAIIHTPGFMLNWYPLFCSVYDVEADPDLTGNLLEKAVVRYSTLPDSLVKSPVPIGFRLIDTTGADPAIWTGKKILHAEPPYLLLEFGK